jgi:myo-inositol 2-dehydrogenase / D-chiro-inositol 1-dehydrogenase
MPMADALNIAVIGAGRMGCTHLRALAGAGSIRVAAVIDPSEPALARAAAISPGVRMHRDLGEAVAAGGIEAVLIAAPSNLHRELVAAAARLRLPILCEKPCGTTTAEIAAAGEACREAGVLLQIGYWRRFVPELIRLRERILSGALGEIALVSCWQWDGDPASPEFRRASGGITVDMGVHEFDQIRWLTGQEIVGLAPVTSPVTSVEPVAGDVESFAMLGELSAGAVAFVSLGRHFVLGDCVWAEVIGTTGYERVEVLWAERGDAVFLAALQAQAEDFAGSVRRGEIGIGATNDDAFRALEIAERAQQRLAPAP